jgi:hypothetical protein
MRVRAALNHYLSSYDLIFADIIEAIIGRTINPHAVYNKSIEAEKVMLRDYLSKIMIKPY